MVGKGSVWGLGTWNTGFAPLFTLLLALAAPLWICHNSCVTPGASQQIKHHAPGPPPDAHFSCS